MNINLSHTLLAAALCSSGFAHGAQICRVSGVAADDTLNIRSGIGMHSPIIGSFAPNEDGLGVFNCQYNGNTKWCLVSDRSRQRSGWVASRYLDCYESAPATTTPQTALNPTLVGSWCQTKPYCSINFEGKTYYFPTGWKVTAPYHDTYAVGRYRTKAATVVSTRQSDGTKAYLNVVQLQRRDCNDDRYPLGSLCFEPSLQPVTARERHIFGGLPNANIANEQSNPPLLSSPVTVIIKAVGNQESVSEWELQSGASWAEFLDGQDPSESLVEAVPQYPYVMMRSNTDGTIRFDTHFSGLVYVHGINGAEEPRTIQEGNIVIEAQPATQCFLIPPIDESGYEPARQAILLRYKLPHHYSGEGRRSGFNDGTQPPVNDSDASDDGHGGDLIFRLAPIPCERLNGNSTDSGTRRIRRTN